MPAALSFRVKSCPQHNREVIFEFLAEVRVNPPPPKRNILWSRRTQPYAALSPTSITGNETSPEASRTVKYASMSDLGDKYWRLSCKVRERQHEDFHCHTKPYVSQDVRGAPPDSSVKRGIMLGRRRKEKRTFRDGRLVTINWNRQSLAWLRDLWNIAIFSFH